MKKYFCESNAYNCVLLVDDDGNGIAVHDSAFDEPLTLEAAKRADYSGLDGFETAEDAAGNYFLGGDVISFCPDDWERVTEF